MADKTLTDKQKAFLAYLATDAQGNIKQAMKLAGYSEHTRTHEVLESLTEEIIAVANKLIAGNSVKAAIKLTDLLDNPGQIGGDKVISAAKEILDRAGVIKKETARQEIRADTVFILPQKDGFIPLDIATNEG